MFRSLFKTLREKFRNLITKKNDNYDNKLIKLLEKQHNQLYNEFLKLKTIIEKEKGKSEIKDQLNSILDLYKIHLIIEDKNLYTYLKKVYSNNNKITTWIISKEEEMGIITNFIQENFNKILSFNYNDKIDYYNSLKIVEEIIFNLKKRVTIEQEILYKLYIDYKSENFNTEELEKLIINKEKEILKSIN